ncbi:hypothetical protein SAMN05216227_103427 [Pseudorhodobacter antarcticus]|uniref:Uncharacterized protein n=1 Tax=Pseudorhodobacter antarcticus TaxID=1077947 RepID=A0A1H8KT71_9RHOB|nr:hypothetical protein SAMN05216227_103427 [Pseudorhodobacter antarcticus]
MGQDLSDIVAAAAEHREEGVADGAFQGTTREPAVGFHMTYFGFDGAAASEVGDQLGCKAASRSAGSCREGGENLKVA